MNANNTKKKYYGFKYSTQFLCDTFLLIVKCCIRQKNCHNNWYRVHWKLSIKGPKLIIKYKLKPFRKLFIKLFRNLDFSCFCIKYFEKLS